MVCTLCTILKMQQCTADAWDLLLRAPEIAAAAQPGQFVDVLCGEKTLRRPLSICDVDPDAGTLRLVFETRGEGTRWLAGRRAGEEISVLGPLGSGFHAANGPVVFVGGGIGTPPLLFAAKKAGVRADVILGFRNAGAVLLTDDFRRQGNRVTLMTDDGSAGEHGLVTAPLAARLDAAPCAAVYACGPRPMLAAVAGEAAGRGIPCEVSMEERMVCGVGACLCCVTRVRENGGETYRHVCKDGPVFDAAKIVW